MDKVEQFKKMTAKMAELYDGMLLGFDLDKEK